MKKNVAIMQPYVFPYLGYFSLVAASDYFVFYDDVHFIKQGWINRNRILINNNPYTFTIPLSNGSSNELISNVKTTSINSFKEKFLKQIEITYKRSSQFETGRSYVISVLDGDCSHISKLAMRSVKLFCEIIGMEREFFQSSSLSPETKGYEKADRLIKITQKLGSQHYINAAGGIDLYNKLYFAKNGVDLSFILPKQPEYLQSNSPEFVPNLSVIDAMMNNSAKDLIHLINRYDII